MGQHIDLDPYLLPMVLCADAVLDGESLIGDPTEGALIVLGAKGGLDIEETRAAFPRIAEVPFDSEYKFMATFHEMTGPRGEPVVRCYVKGAPDVLISRSASYREPDGTVVPVTDENRHLALEANDRIAEGGERVMVVAQRDFDPATVDRNGDLLGLVQDLTLLAMVGIVDPPRPEARDAIAECKSAGIRVRMITGDHATTAGAIGKELGIEGRAITGAEFAAMSDDELLRQLPEHRRDRAGRPGGQGAPGQDAPAQRPHRRDDRGRRERCSRVEVGQHRRRDGDHRYGGLQGGRGDDPHRRQLRHDRRCGGVRTGALRQPLEVPAIPDVDPGRLHRDLHRGRDLRDRRRHPLNPLQILWLNMVVDIPIAIALGFDEPSRGLMERAPRPVGAPVLSTSNWVRLCAQGFVMTVGALLAYQIGESNYGEPLVASTMLLTTLSLFHLVAGLLARDQVHTIFDRDAVPGPAQLRRYGLSLLAIVGITAIGFLQRVFSTTSLTFEQWWICVGLAASLVVVEELIKVFVRRRTREPSPTSVDEPAAMAA